jgi:16S rRNA G527 N7-methylase RsmG
MVEILIEMTEEQKASLDEIAKELGTTDVETFQASLDILKHMMAETKNGDVRAVREMSELINNIKKAKKNV